MTKTEVKSFRTDFEKAVAQLEKHYGVSITLKIHCYFLEIQDSAFWGLCY